MAENTMNSKIFVISIDFGRSLNVSKEIIKRNDDLSIASTFTTDPEKEGMGINDNYEYYMDMTTAALSFKNNSLLYVSTDTNLSKGIVIDDLYNYDVFPMTVANYNSIADKVFDKFDVLTVWIDVKNSSSISKQDLAETQYLMERLDSNKYMYFLKESDGEIAEVVEKYLKTEDEEEKNNILVEFL